MAMLSCSVKGLRPKVIRRFQNVCVEATSRTESGLVGLLVPPVALPTRGVLDLSKAMLKSFCMAISSC